MAARVLCVGVAVQDNIFAVEKIPSSPTKNFATDFGEAGGGPAANAAVTVSRLGGQAALWARVGGDHLGERIIKELRESGVDTRHIRQIPGRRSGVSAVVVDRNGERMITAYADKELDRNPDWLPVDEIDSFDAVLADVRWPTASERVLRAARDKSVPSVLDADLTTDDAIAKLAPLADHTVFSLPGLQRFTDISDPQEALQSAQARVGGLVGVTLGSRGFTWLEAGKPCHVPAFTVEAIDTLAAGDVFHGAYALGIAEGRGVADAARLAAATAALKCTRWGGRAGIPARSEVESLLQGQLAAT
ncbi:PfkB family carbohydrate kinase [Microvirga pudoricolor]|uniref:PfkB family carbohydrate kinase n=1 Tax=Microvirga pudoricolor TaxID=2778729 RepID=UPI001951C1FF|nr:PfkB family carbohydrate kinase [Microvirga pudoricolor]MBM6595106.1 ribokinase [Microvirga pudoricolor]